MVKSWNEGQVKINYLLASEVGRYSVLHFLYSPEKSLYFFLLLWHCFRESLSAPLVRAGGVEKPLPANCSICSNLQKCSWCWYQTVPLSNLVFHSMFVTLKLGRPFAHASLLPAREEAANEAENLSWNHQEELLPASIVGWRKGAVSTSLIGEKLGALLKLFLRFEAKIMNPGLFFLSVT